MTDPDQCAPGRVEDRCVEKGCTAPAVRRGRCHRDYRRLLRMGRCGHQDAATARQHLAALRDLGWTWDAIAATAGVSSAAARHIHGGQAHAWPETVQALLAVPLTPYDSRRSIDSAGARRRVQALAWMGWTCADVAERAGLTAEGLRSVTRPGRRISFATARQVTAVYDLLCMAQGPSTGAANSARRRGYLPPLAWDDELIDLPDDELAAELIRLAREMDNDELRLCWRGWKAGDPSVLIVAGVREYWRRRDARDRARKQAA